MAQTESIPEHIAIIMDGNGRWANSRRMGRSRGHRAGANRVDDIVTHCGEIGVKYLTLYAFSTENWNRPPYEVAMLWRLMVTHLKQMDKKLLKNKVSLLAQGTLDRIPDFARAELDRVIKLTHLDEPKLKLTLSLSYGGRQEIIDGVQAIVKLVGQGRLRAEDINETTFRNFLYKPEIPDPDLMIRTGGEFRTSNFLLWQGAYTELFVTEILWPDFTIGDLDNAIAEYGSRQRRFGMTGKQVQAVKNRRNEAPPSADIEVRT